LKTREVVRPCTAAVTACLVAAAAQAGEEEQRLAGGAGVPRDSAGPAAWPCGGFFVARFGPTRAIVCLKPGPFGEGGPALRGLPSGLDGVSVSLSSSEFSVSVCFLLCLNASQLHGQGSQTPQLRALA
jgi:hypothetical protein